MSTKEYQELISLTKQYLAQEFQNNEYIDEKPPEWIVSELQTYNYFKEYAIQNKNPKIKQAAVVIPAPVQQPRYEPPVQTKQVVQPEPKIEIMETPVTNVQKPIEPTPTPVVETEKKKGFELEPIKATTPADLSDVKRLVQELFPNQIIIDSIPQNTFQVIIISDHTEKHFISFLNNYAKAIDLNLGTSKIMTSKKFQESPRLNSLKMIIQATDATISHDGVALLQLSDLAQYFKEPVLKLELWKLTTSKFSNG